jgi:hypothetical protein
MSKTTANLNELIEVLNDGVNFYDDAAMSRPVSRNCFFNQAGAATRSSSKM